MEIPTPDRTIVAALKRIDPGLTVEWVDPPARWAICHDVQFPGNFDREVDATARTMQEALAANGYIIPYEDVLWEAVRSVRARRVIFYVANEDGSWRQIDHRDVKRIELMDYYRRELSIGDWKQMANTRARVAREAVERDRASIWESVKKDKVFASQLGDILWGSRPFRSVIVPTGIERVSA